MNSNLKVLGRVLTAVLVLGAILAQAASAKDFHSGSASGTTFLTGVQVGTNNLDLANGTTIKCSSVVFDGSYAGSTASKELAITPTYSGCTAAGQTATLETTGCGYMISTPTQLADNDHYDAGLKISCPPEKLILVKIPTAGCEIKVLQQIPTGSLIHLSNTTTATANQDDVLMTSTVTGVHYTTVGGGICGAAGEGKFTGNVTFRAYSNAGHSAQVDLWIL